MGFSHIAVTTEIDPKVTSEKHPVRVIVLFHAMVIVTFGWMLVGGPGKDGLCRVVNSVTYVCAG